MKENDCVTIHIKHFYVLPLILRLIHLHSLTTCLNFVIIYDRFNRMFQIHFDFHFRYFFKSNDFRFQK